MVLLQLKFFFFNIITIGTITTKPTLLKEFLKNSASGSFSSLYNNLNFKLILFFIKRKINTNQVQYIELFFSDYKIPLN